MNKILKNNLAPKHNFWRTNKDTILGGIIFTGLNIGGFFIKEHIKRRQEDLKREKEGKERRDFIRFQNEQDFELFRRKTDLRMKYQSVCSEPDCNEPDWEPLQPKLYDPLEPIESHEDSRLFASAIHKGDIGVVIAAKSVGKTTLFMQIADKIARGEPTGLWPNYDEGKHAPQKVLYYDGELKESDMYDRYYKYGFDFSDNFERFDRTQIHSIDDVLRDLEGKVEKGVITGDTTIVIDNVTKLLETAQVDKIKKFNDRIEEIHSKAAAKNIALTVISMIHVLSKEYKDGTPITKKVAAGGSDLTNYTNFVIALERPRNEGDTLLVKILNSRGEPEPDEVCVLLRKDGEPYLRFEYCGEMDEKTALKGTGKLTQQPKQSKAERAAEIQAKLAGGMTYDEVAAEYGVTRQTIYNWLKGM